MNKESFDCKVFDEPFEARKHGLGGIWYTYNQGSGNRFPEDVQAVHIMMAAGEGEDRHVAYTRWSVSKPNHCGAQWQLSGTREKPTLSPSLHWVSVWHGYLKNGRCESC